jgi:hypothetical protein
MVTVKQNKRNETKEYHVQIQGLSNVRTAHKLRSIQCTCLYFCVSVPSNCGIHIFVVRSLKDSIFWDTTPFSPFKPKQSFGETFPLHLQDFKI